MPGMTKKDFYDSKRETKNFWVVTMVLLFSFNTALPDGKYFRVPSKSGVCLGIQTDTPYPVISKTDGTCHMYPPCEHPPQHVTTVSALLETAG